MDWFWQNKPDKEDKLGFMKILAKVETDPYIHDGEEESRADGLPGAVFLRGGSVAILIIVQLENAKGDKDKYVVLTKQPRIAAGSLEFTEIPAGMLDGDTFKGSAASEIEQEAHLKVKESELINMSELALDSDDDSSTDDSDSESESSTPSTPESSTTSHSESPAIPGIYPSPGACDEHIPLFLCQKRLTRKHMAWLTGKATGLRDEGEIITLKLVPLATAWKYVAGDAKALAALCLYHSLRREGRLDDVPAEVEPEPEELAG